MTISKRIDGQECLLQSPTVDVSKYRRTVYVPPEKVEVGSVAKRFSAEDPYLMQQSRSKPPLPSSNNRLSKYIGSSEDLATV